MSHTGRYYVTDIKSGRKFCVEPIDSSVHHKIWGDINPATKDLEGTYGKKYKGGLPESESIITKENGFKNITILSAGENPEDYINSLITAGIV